MFSTSASQVSTAANYIEDVFSTWLRNGTGAAATITTGLNASTNKSLVWTKSRSSTNVHKLTDTVRGATKGLVSNSDAAQTTDATGLTAFSSTGYTVNSNVNYNNSSAIFVDWQFVAAPKFFDIVTYTGTGANRTISHNLGSVPGCIIVKRTDTTGNWQVYHNSLTSAAYSIQLNLTNAQASAPTVWNSTAPTSTVFSVGTDATVNASGGTYVAYLFAHNAGGFGLTGTDNVISCGSFTTDGSGNATVNLGYEPQWVLYRLSSTTDDWWISDNMRGMSLTKNQGLFPDLSVAESNQYPNGVKPTATGFTYSIGIASQTGIYIAIRRGPMKVPTSGTSVFSPVSRTGTGTDTTITSGFPVDMTLTRRKNGVLDTGVYDRLRGPYIYLITDANNAEQSSSNSLVGFDSNTEVNVGVDTVAGNINNTGWLYSTLFFRRAPGFFDEVCYTGTGSATTFSHNLGVVPEFMIVKRRDSINNWLCYQSALGNDRQISLNLSAAVGGSSITLWNNTTPTNAVFSVGTNAGTNASGGTYVNYLFATCPGVSKVGSYTGTGATQTINCGFTGGARFVLIKRTDSTGDWYVWDTARGMVAGTDPSLLLNSTAAEVNANSVYTTGVGFQIVSTAAGINASGGSYIFLAIA